MSGPDGNLASGETPLTQVLRARIRAEGPISVAEFMREALLHPHHGYYATRDPFGQGGDFITAPEISQMFGEICALALALAWMDRGGGPMLLVEPGPGRGTLMADMLRVLARVPDLRPQVHLIEASAHLRSVQRARLDGHDVTWHERLETVPEGPLYMVANEFLDALPIQQFSRAQGGWREHQLGLVAGELAFGLAPEQSVPALDHLAAHTPLGAVAEMCLPAQRFVGAVAGRIARHGGAALFVDYGGWASLGDTLQALKAHQPVPVLSEIGQADLTAHVDFERVAAAARASGAEVSALLTQGTWLNRLGIAARAEALCAALARRGDAGALKAHHAAHHRLTAPAEMGELFKVIGVFARGTPVLAGFETADPALS